MDDDVYAEAFVGLSKLLSVRLTDEDAVFLSALQVDGAVTASDKVRALIREARLKAEAPADMSNALALSRTLLDGPGRALRAAEDRADARSDVAKGLMLSLEEMLALAVTAESELAAGDLAALTRFEAKLTDRAARLTEALLRWGVTPSAPAYDPKVVRERLTPLIDLMRLLTQAPKAK
jgi:hypothetical protein